MEDKLKHYYLDDAKLDQEHREILLALNQLRMDLESNTTTVGSALPQVVAIISHCESHFALEDKMMIDADYPYRADHIKSHIELMNLIKKRLAAADKYTVSNIAVSIF